MKHILIPTDFSIPSLNAVHAVVGHCDNVKVRITLFHLLKMSTDISLLMFPSQRNKHNALIKEDFKEAVQILQNGYTSRIQNINTEFGFGSTVSYLQNFLEGARVDGIVFCPDMQLTLPSARSVDMVPLLKKTKFPIQAIPSRAYQSDINVISMLFGNELKVPKEENYAVKK